MIEFKTGNIHKQEAEALVNPVNCVGVMGKGLALQFKNLYPDNFKAYRLACKTKLLIPGKILIFERQETEYPKYIVNFPTKRDWRDRSRIEDIDSGLESLAQEMSKLKIKSIAIPALGCGLGGLDWTKVKERILTVLAPVSHSRIIVLEPQGNCS